MQSSTRITKRSYCSLWITSSQYLNDALKPIFEETESLNPAKKLTRNEKINSKKLPYLFFFHLKRCVFNVKTFNFEKYQGYFYLPFLWTDVDRFVDNPEIIMSEHLQNGVNVQHIFNQMVRVEGVSKMPTDVLKMMTTWICPKDKKLTYELVGLVMHTGTGLTGRYYGCFKDLMSELETVESSPDGCWVKFDDVLTACVNNEHVAQTFGGNDATTTSHGVGYFAVYRQRNIDFLSMSLP